MPVVGDSFSLLAENAGLGSLYCLVCGTPMEEQHGCRFQCPRCGHTIDCSDPA